MTKARYSDKRDANEAEIIAWLREQGCRVIQMPRGAGYDLQVFAPGGYILPPIEVKNPRYHWEYEKAEADLMVWCHDNGVAYLTITSLEDIQVAFGEFVWVAARPILAESMHGYRGELPFGGK